jgi:hypothetical protein
MVKVKKKFALSLFFSSVSLLIIIPTTPILATHSDSLISDCTTPVLEPTKQYETTSPTWVSTYTVDDNHEVKSKDCDISVEEVESNHYFSGEVTYKAIATNSKSQIESELSKVYWVKEVNLYLVDGKGVKYGYDETNGISSSSQPLDGNPTNSSSLTTYSDESVPTVECIKTYGDNSTKDCTDSISVVVDENLNGKEGQRLTCYYYEDPLTRDSDKICTIRIYVQKVEITSGPTKTYTGLHHNYECRATFYDGKTVNVNQLPDTSQNYIWSSHPWGESIENSKNDRFIGTSWFNKGYTDPRGEKHLPDTLHDFYPIDPDSKDYIITCSYFPDDEWVQEFYDSEKQPSVKHQNDWITDYETQSNSSPWHSTKHDTITVSHIGIDKLWTEVTGIFSVYKHDTSCTIEPSEPTGPTGPFTPTNDNNGETNDFETESMSFFPFNFLFKKAGASHCGSDSTSFEQKTYSPTTNQDPFPGGWNLEDSVTGETYSPGYWDQSSFEKDSWYDFRAYIKYADGLVRDVTSADEVYWDSTPWYEGREKFNTEFSYHSGMSETGLDHRIPREGWNTIDVEYLHQNLPLNNAAINKTKTTNRLTTRHVKRLDIKHSESFNREPISFISENDPKTVQYSAWVTWSDDTVEDWTTSVDWEGDYYGDAKGYFDFSDLTGANQKTTIHAQFENVDDLLGSGSEDDSDANHSYVEVTVTNCQNVDHLAIDCTTPTGYWRTDVPSNFDAFNVSDNPNVNFFPGDINRGGMDIEDNLYLYERLFPVSGTSTGLGSQ